MAFNGADRANLRRAPLAWMSVVQKLPPEPNRRCPRSHFTTNHWRLNVNRNGLYLIIGALIVVAAGLAVYVYREETKPAGIEMKIGEGGVSIQEN